MTMNQQLTKKQMERPEALIFDLDGTLFKTESLIIPAYHAVFEQLRAEHLYEGDTPPVERMLETLGLLLEDIWENVLPGISPQLMQRANELLWHFQKQGLENGSGELYEDVKTTLEQLHASGFRLFVASNGLQPYIEGVMTYKGLAPLFTGLYSAGGYQTASKVDLVKILLQQHGITNAWMIGDRSSDVEAGKRNGLYVIGCQYAGFGQAEELQGADHIIHSFAELTDLLL